MSIKENREKELRTKAEELKAKELADVKEKTIIETMQDVKDGKVRSVADDKGHPTFVAGGKYLQKMVLINGMPCMCTGKDEEELEADIQAAKVYAAEHGNSACRMLKDLTVAEELVEAGLVPNKEFKVGCKTYFIFYKERIAMDSEGNTVADLSDIEDNLSNATIELLLTERVKNRKK